MTQIVSNSAFIVLYSNNILLTHEFYLGIGCSIEQIEVDKCLVNLAGHNLHIIDSSTEPFKEYLPQTTSEYRGKGVLFYFEVAEVETFVEKVVSLGGTVLTGVKENHWGGKELMFSDPNGYNLIAYQMIN